jgi:oxygen-dependent protoporphyrinogen oxidase
MRIAVAGGGITGLAAAWFLRGSAEVTLFEPHRVGGKILTSDFGGRRVDEGPDAFITRTPDAVDLCRALGIGDDLVAPATGHASLWARGRLRPLPPNVLGVPTDLGALWRSGVVSRASVARAALDLVLPATKLDDDRSLGDVLAARIGRGAALGMVDALLGGIHAGRTEELSIRATAPQLASAVTRHRSLIRGLANDRRRQAAASPGPVFLTPPGGVGQLVERLQRHLGGAITRRRVEQISRGADGAWSIDGEPFDGVILAVPAPVAAGLVAPHSAAAASELRSIRHSSVVVTTLAYRSSAMPADRFSGSGFLVPRPEGRLMTACTFGSNKWPHWSGPDTVVVRASAGRDGDERVLDLPDGRIVDMLHAELTEAVGVTEAPVEARVSRWPDAFAQYAPGHLGRVARIERSLAGDAPGIVVAGATYRGVGIPACIASARQAADALTAEVAAEAGARGTGTGTGTES